MPTTDSGESTAGRVTRSLRKRLTSIDSDASSRPGTPIVTNLQTISETVTPSKRVTRRTSLSTPIATPSKALRSRIDSTDVINSPARRSTRRRSVSVQDQELPTPAKSKDPPINTVKEEETTPELQKNRRVTRSSSKSPLEVLTLQSKLDLSKSQNKSAEKGDVIIDLDNSNENVTPSTPPATRNRKQTKVLIKKEKNIDELVQASPPQESPPKSAQKCVEKGFISPAEQKSSTQGSNKKLRVSIERSSSIEPEAEQRKESAKKENLKSGGEITPTNEVDASEEENVSLRSSSSKKKLSLTPNRVTRSSPVKIQQEKASPQKKKTRPEKLKNVAFDETADEDTIKSVFPKTPGLTKSKSYILDSSKDNEKESSNHSINEDENKSDKADNDDELNEVLCTKTPYKLKLKAVESSTPIQSASPKKSGLAVVEEKNDKSTKENEETDGNTSFPKSWSHNVSGTVTERAKIDSINSEESIRKQLEAEAVSTPIQSASPKQREFAVVEDKNDKSAKENEETEGNTSFPKSWSHNVSGNVTEKAKIDSIKSEESIRKQLQAEEALKKSESFSSQNQSKGKQRKNVIDDSDDDEDELLQEEDDYDEEMEEEEEEEERNRERTIFVDNEAMEVPEGEESMDSEERQYLEENEVPVYGESIGSEDSEEDTDYECEEQEEDDDGFIVSDSEDVLQIADESNESEIESVEQERKKQRKYKRIMKCSESSVEEENPSKAGEQDFCLTLDSSVEEENRDISKKDKLESNFTKEDHSSSKTVEESTTNKRKSLLNEAVTTDGPKIESEVLQNTEENKGKEETSKQRKSLKNEEQVDRVDLPSKRKSLRKTEEQQIKQMNVDERGEEQQTKELSKKGRKSLNTPNRKVEEKVSDVENDNLNLSEATGTELSSQNKSRKSLSRNKPRLSRGEDDIESYIRKPISPLESLNHEQRENENVPLKRRSTTTCDKEENEANVSNKADRTLNESAAPSKETPNKSKKSLNKSKTTTSQGKNDLESSRQEQNSPSESLIDENRENDVSAIATTRRSTPINGEEENNVNTSLKASKRYESESKETEDKEDQSTSRRSSRKSIKNNAVSDQEENPNKSDRNTSLNQTRKSLNNSANNSRSEKRKSLLRTSTDEAAEEEEQQQLHQSRSSNRSKLEKSFQSYKDGSEPEETLSASEGRSLNSSRRSRKSLNQSRSMENYADEYTSQEEEDDLKQEEKDFENSRLESVNKNISLRVETDSEEEKNEEFPHESDDGEGEEACFSEAESDHQHINEAEKTMMDFLGEEASSGCQGPTLNSSRRKSINNSKLDETFELDTRRNSISMNNSLHRSIMRKSLNHSQLHREIINENNNATDSEEDANNSAHSSVEEEVEVIKKTLPERGLSVSLSSIEVKKKKLKGEKNAIHNSFTIGVSVRSNQLKEKETSSHSNRTESDNEAFSEEEELENVKNVHRIGPYKARNSLSTSLKTAALNTDEIRQQKRIKRTSLYLQKDENASQSFVENIREEKRKVDSKRKRSSNSFCGVIAPPVETEVEKEPKSERKQKQPSGGEEVVDTTNIKRILNRCEEILEAANIAKREAKMNAKKVKVKKPKWMDKEEEKLRKKEDEVNIPLVSRKELKRKEKGKKEFAKALKHSAALLKIADSKLGKKTQPTQNTEATEVEDSPVASKRLPTEILEAIGEAPLPKKKKSKEVLEVETTPPSDKENSKRNKIKSAYTISDAAETKKRRAVEVLETASGTVIVEPSTPKKLRCQHGFRESPKTPVGFKIQDINSAGQKNRARKNGKKLYTASGEFIEEDLSISKASTKQEKTQKRKRHIEEPMYSLPKTQWTSSGVFVEEDLYTAARPLANSTATKFMVTSLNGGKKSKNSSSVVSAATLNSALNFKQNALFNDKSRRETSRALIHRKQRKLANSQF